MIILLSVAVFVSTLALIIGAVNLFMLFRQNTVHKQQIEYLDRIVKYGDGLADIQSRLKDMAIEHNEIMIKTSADATDLIIKHVTFTNRWQKVIAKLIKVGATTPLATATGSETLLEAEALHKIGLDIADVAFKDQQALIEESDDERNPQS